MKLRDFRKLEEGDKVLLKTKEELIKEFGFDENGWINTAIPIGENKSEHLGKVLTIDEIYVDLGITTEEAQSSTGQWFFSYDTIKRKMEGV